MSKLNRRKKLTIFGMKHFGFFVVLWYRITLFFTRKHGYPVETVDNINKIPEKLDFGADYKPDPKIDTMYHPSRAQKMITTQSFNHFDCDDHAVYWATVIRKSKLAKKVWLGIVRFIVNGKSEGHVVCVYQDDSGQYWWGDYNYPSKIDDKWDFAEMSANGYGSHAYAAALIEVNEIKSNDTPKLGKYSARSF